MNPCPTQICLSICNAHLSQKYTILFLHARKLVFTGKTQFIEKSSSFTGKVFFLPKISMESSARTLACLFYFANRKISTFLPLFNFFLQETLLFYVYLAISRSQIMHTNFVVAAATPSGFAPNEIDGIPRILLEKFSMTEFYLSWISMRFFVFGERQFLCEQMIVSKEMNFSVINFFFVDSNALRI